MADQRKLFGDNVAKRPAWLNDYQALPDKVWPTRLSVLLQGGDLLFHRHADAVKLVSPTHERILRRLVGLSEPCRHCGNSPDTDVQAIATTGIEGVTHDRLIAIYDHMHNDEKLRLAGEGEIPARIHDWFVAREGRR